MKIQTRIKRYAWLALGVAALLPVSCIKDDYATESGQTTLTLRFSASANAPEATGAIAPETVNEQMRTLRVILTEKDGTIRYNWKKNDIPVDATDQVVTFSELITVSNGVTNFDVYAIANEESFVKTADELAAKSGNISQFNFDVNLLDATILDRLNEANKADPDNDERIPQTKVQEVEVIPGQANSATIQLKFAVAKIDLSFTNQSPSQVVLEDVKFSHMNVATTPLFPPTDLPSTGSDLNLGTINVPGNVTNYSVVRYVYESQVTGNDSYILSTSWGNKSLNLTEAGLGTEFARGTKLDIDLTLNSTQITTFNLLVEPWGEKNIDVPPFL